jgi:hypothetical protein
LGGFGSLGHKKLGQTLVAFWNANHPIAWLE